MSRYLVQQRYLAALGRVVSEVIDTQSTRRILIAGADHAARAKARVEELEQTTTECPPAPR